MVKAMWKKTFAIFMDFLQTAKVFPTDFTTAILSANKMLKVVFVLVKSKL